MAWPGMMLKPSRLLATALAEICTVPNTVMMATTRMRPAWNRLFSKAEGIPMRRMRPASAVSTWCSEAASRQTVFSGFAPARRISTAATARDTTLGQATPATPIFRPNTHTALPTTLIRFIRMLTRMERRELPMLRNWAAPALYSARNG